MPWYNSPTPTNMRAASRRPRRCAGTSTRTSSRAARFDLGHESTCPTACRWCRSSRRSPTPRSASSSQIQGRTYANVFGLVERFITAKLIEIGRDHSLGDQNALEALVRFSDEELKHQTLFRRIEAMMGEVMPAGYRFDVDPDAVARAVLAKSTWAVLVLTLHIELFVQNHYRQSIEPDGELSELFKDVFLFHWKDECQHVVLDELELQAPRRHAVAEGRDRAVDDFIDLVVAVDGILQVQAKADAAYFAANCGRTVGAREAMSLAGQFLKAYRWQYIFSGAIASALSDHLKGLITPSRNCAHRGGARHARTARWLNGRRLD